MGIKRKVKVSVICELEIELTDKLFGKSSEKDYVEAFNKYIYDIDSIDDVFAHAGHHIAQGNIDCEVDFLGRLGTDENCDTRYKELHKFFTCSVIGNEGDIWDV